MNVKQTREHMQMMDDIALLKMQITELKDRLVKLEAKRGPGRPRKSNAAKAD